MMGWITERGGDSLSRQRRIVVQATIAVILLVVSLSGASSAAAASGSPWWHASTRMFPSNLPPGGEATVVLTAINLGDGQVTGVPQLAESFPEGYSVQSIKLFAIFVEQGKIELANVSAKTFSGPYCTHGTTSAQCRVDLPQLASPEFGSFNKGEAVVNPDEDIEMLVTVRNEGVSASGAQMSAEVTGGETPTVRVSQPLPTTSAPPTFGVEHFSVTPEEEGGGVAVQAGAHPFQLTSSLTINEGPDQTRPLAMTRDLKIKLPPGLVGNASRIARCTDAELRELGEEEGGVGIAATVNKCPADSMVGFVNLTFDEPNLGGVVTNPVPIFNMVPAEGEPARFGFEVAQAPVLLDTEVRTGSDYGVTVDTRNITQLVSFISATVTFWGVPGDERHDASRGWPCFITGKWYTIGENPPCVHARESNPRAFLSLPTSCGRFATSVEGFSWATASAPGGETLPRLEDVLSDEFGRELGIAGCGTLRFEPSIEVTPEVSRPSSPSGMRVDLRMPEEADETANGTASATIKDLTVSLPAGVAVNPASAGGLEACSESAVGYEAGASAPPGSLSFSPHLPQGWEAGLGFCPSASKIGTVSIVSRLLPPGQTVNGSVYLAAQTANPFESLLALYIVAEDPLSGVAVKLAGKVSPDPISGQLTATLRNVPQLPFETATLKFFGGPRAALATPATCGNYTTTVSATPWSENTHASSSSSFTIGNPCPAHRSFQPTLSNTPQSIQAGAFTSLSTSVGLADGSQALRNVAVQLPPGFSGILKGIPLCGDAEANAGTCGVQSLIGHATALIGFGPEPFEVTGGQVFLTESYRGAPFGLSIVTPAKAGPFDLGTVVVRARIEVDPHTAQISVVTDSSGAHAIPAILDGIPLAIRQVNVSVDRSGFTFNPTNCAPLQSTGSIGSDEAANVLVSTPFQVANCATLKFTPSVTITAGAHSSKAKGSSLSFKIVYPKGAFGSQSWFNEAKFDIPKQLPARLTTIQKACLASVFESNRAACPAGSQIGHAVVRTPLLPVPLTGPVYFVSHGGAKFPDAVLVLQGYGVTVDLVGETFINGKTGVTSATFRNTPDVPFESIEVSLPTGPGSEFGANLPASAHGSFCGRTLTMPTLFKAQNGLEIHQNTKVGVAGCAKAKAKRKKHAPAKHRKKH